MQICTKKIKKKNEIKLLKTTLSVKAQNNYTQQIVL